MTYEWLQDDLKVDQIKIDDLHLHVSMTQYDRQREFHSRGDQTLKFLLWTAENQDAVEFLKNSRDRHVFYIYMHDLKSSRVLNLGYFTGYLSEKTKRTSGGYVATREFFATRFEGPWE